MSWSIPMPSTLLKVFVHTYLPRGVDISVVTCGRDWEDVRWVFQLSFAEGLGEVHELTNVYHAGLVDLQVITLGLFWCLLSFFLSSFFRFFDDIVVPCSFVMLYLQDRTRGWMMWVENLRYRCHMSPTGVYRRHYCLRRDIHMMSTFPVLGVEVLWSGVK